MALTDDDMIITETSFDKILLTTAVVDTDSSFTENVHAYFSKLLPVAFRITKDQHAAEDIVQEAFLKLWEKRAQIIPGNIGGWLYIVVTNAAYKHVKKEAQKMQLYRFLVKDKHDVSAEAEERLTHKETVTVLNKLCRRLPEKQRLVFRLSQQEDLSRKEIAVQLNISPNTVKVHLLRAAQFIKEHMVSACLLILFFVFNNLFFSSSNTRGMEKDLYKVCRTQQKPLQKMFDPFLYGQSPAIEKTQQK